MANNSQENLRQVPQLVCTPEGVMLQIPVPSLTCNCSERWRIEIQAMSNRITSLETEVQRLKAILCRRGSLDSSDQVMSGDGMMQPRQVMSEGTNSTMKSAPEQSLLQNDVDDVVRGVDDDGKQSDHAGYYDESRELDPREHSRLSKFERCSRDQEEGEDEGETDEESKEAEQGEGDEEGEVRVSPEKPPFHLDQAHSNETDHDPSSSPDDSVEEPNSTTAEAKNDDDNQILCDECGLYYHKKHRNRHFRAVCHSLRGVDPNAECIIARSDSNEPLVQNGSATEPDAALPMSGRQVPDGNQMMMMGSIPDQQPSPYNPSNLTQPNATSGGADVGARNAPDQQQQQHLGSVNATPSNPHEHGHEQEEETKTKYDDWERIICGECEVKYYKKHEPRHFRTEGHLKWRTDPLADFFRKRTIALQKALEAKKALQDGLSQEAEAQNTPPSKPQGRGRRKQNAAKQLKKKSKKARNEQTIAPERRSSRKRRKVNYAEDDGNNDEFLAPHDHTQSNSSKRTKTVASSPPSKPIAQNEFDEGVGTQGQVMGPSAPEKPPFYLDQAQSNETDHDPRPSPDDSVAETNGTTADADCIITQSVSTEPLVQNGSAPEPDAALPMSGGQVSDGNQMTMMGSIPGEKRLSPDNPSNSTQPNNATSGGADLVARNAPDQQQQQHLGSVNATPSNPHEQDNVDSEVKKPAMSSKLIHTQFRSNPGVFDIGKFLGILKG